MKTIVSGLFFFIHFFNHLVMKNILFNLIACLFTLLAGISTITAQTVSKAEAQAVATHFFQTQTGRADAQLSLKRLKTSKDQNAGTKASDEFFLFTPISGTGFVIVSADKNAPPILAYSDHSQFDIEHIPPQAQYMLDLYTQQIFDIRKSGYQADNAIKSNWEALSKGTYYAPEDPTSAGPLLTTTWDQGGAYNQFCPTNKNGPIISRAATGCVATSMAQIIRYWRFPNGVDYHQVHLVDNDISDIDPLTGLNTDMVTIDSTIWLGGGYNWNNMPNSMTTSSPTDIARLMLHTGFSIGMDYGIGGSEAFTYNVPNAMHDHFGYVQSTYVERSSMSQSAWDQSLRQALDNGVPLIYRAPGHAWVCDGYSIYFGATFYNMNWGWGGSANGFYDLNALSANGKNYNAGQCAVFGLVPPDCPVSNFSTGVAIGSIEVAQTITATSTIGILPGLNVTFDAGESIVLLPGFVAPSGCTFTALIEGCGGVFFNHEEEAEQRSSGLEPLEELPTTADLGLTMNIAPNPFSGNTTVTYSLDSEQSVGMTLMDVTGRLVGTPLPTQTQSEGRHQFNLEAGSLPAGMYFLVLQMGEKNETKRLILSK